MDKKTMLALAEANAIKKVQITGSGSLLYISIKTPTGEYNIETNAGKLKTWSSALYLLNSGSSADLVTFCVVCLSVRIA